jgi:Uma2 family endonuclease
MATTTETTTRAETTDAETPIGDQCVVMHDIDWNGYTTMLRLRGGHSRPRMVYLDGDLFLVSPACTHERVAERLGLFVMEVVAGFDIPCIMAGSTTFRRRKKKGGVEGDKSFYLANAERIRVRKGKNIHLRKDPPPDLAVESVNTHEADAAIEVWRRFGVREVWVENGDRLQILALATDGQYAESPHSVSFPFLAAGEIHEWVSRPDTEFDTDWIKALRKWVAGPLAERYRATQTGNAGKEAEQ